MVMKMSDLEYSYAVLMHVCGKCDADMRRLAVVVTSTWSKV